VTAKGALTSGKKIRGKFFAAATMMAAVALTGPFAPEKHKYSDLEERRLTYFASFRDLDDSGPQEPSSS
jgi:hypothetical protein